MVINNYPASTKNQPSWARIEKLGSYKKMRRIFHSFFIRSLLIILIGTLGLMGSIQPAHAENIDSYLRRYLKVTEAVPLKINDKGDTRLFSPDGY